MSQYPNAVYTPRTKQNKTGVIYDPSDPTKLFAEDVVYDDGEIVSIETELGLLPKATSASVSERLKGIRSFSDAISDVLVVKGGNVGIGTPTPGAKLDVNGAIKQDRGQRVNLSGRNKTWKIISYPKAFTYSDNSETFIINLYDSSNYDASSFRTVIIGKVGNMFIGPNGGDQSSNYPVSIKTYENGDNIDVYVVAPTYADLYTLDFVYNRLNTVINPVDVGSDTYAPAGSLVGNTATAPYYVNVGDTTRMTILGNGNVGIGTADPGAKLQVNTSSINENAVKLVADTTTSAITQIFNNAGGDYFLGAESSTGNRVTMGGLPYSFVMNTELLRPIQFGTNNTSRMIIDTIGNVGIGTNSPTNALELGNDRTLRVQGSSASNDTYGVSVGGYGYFGIDAPGVANGRFVVKNNGNVGIGTTTPTSLLQTNGAIATPISTKTATYTMTINDSVILADVTTASFAINLPTAVGITGRQYTIKKIDSSANTITIDASGTETIDGATTKVLTTQWAKCKIVSNGANWFVISE